MNKMTRMLVAGLTVILLTPSCVAGASNKILGSGSSPPPSTQNAMPTTDEWWLGRFSVAMVLDKGGNDGSDLTEDDVFKIQNLVRHNYPNICYVNKDGNPSIRVIFTGADPNLLGISWKTDGLGHVFVFEGGGGIECECEGDGGDRLLAIANVTCHEIGHMRGFKVHLDEPYRFMTGGERNNKWLLCHILLTR